MKCLFAAVAAVPLALSAPVAAPSTGPYPHDESLIVPVICTLGAGTAFKIGWNTYVTAEHVSDNEGCAIDGMPIDVTRHESINLDMTILRGPASPRSLPISCAGFKPGAVYLARGHVPGAWFMALPWLATEIVEDGQRVLVGEAIPGMSGGAVLDRKGRVVGVVSKRLAARATSLSDTSLCP
jgi:hypothetical protein